MKYIILEKAQAKVGHVIMVNDGEEAEVTAVGEDGVTARDEKGKKFQVLHDHVKVKGKGGKEEEEEPGKEEQEPGKKETQLEVADDEEDKESEKEKAGKKVAKKKKSKVPPAERAKMGEVNPSGKEQ